MGNNPGAILTAEEVLGSTNLENKVVIVTGSNTGIGRETARVLAKAGAHVIIAARDQKKSENTKLEILSQNKNAKVDILDLDLGDFKSVDKFIEDFTKLKLPLHIFVANAGVMMTPQKTTKDGFEFQNGVNHYGHSRMILKLLPLMAESEGQKRIVILSSRGHLRGSQMIDYEDFHFKKRKYDPLDSYAQSKLACLLFAKELNRKLQSDFGDKFICCSVHPGVIQTELQRDLPEIKKFLIMTTMKVTQGIKTIPQGAATTVYGCVSPKVKGGEYLADCSIAVEILKYAEVEENQKKLFEFTEKEIGVSYPFNKKEETKSEKKEQGSTMEKRLGENIWTRAESVSKVNHEEFYTALGFPEEYLKTFIEKPTIFETRGDLSGYDMKLVSPLMYECSGKWAEEVYLDPLRMFMNVKLDLEKQKSYIIFTLDNGKKYTIVRTVSEDKIEDEMTLEKIVAKTTYKRIKL